jgi:hypothetical protein
MSNPWKLWTITQCQETLDDSIIYLIRKRYELKVETQINESLGTTMYFIYWRGVKN